MALGKQRSVCTFVIETCLHICKDQSMHTRGGYLNSLILVLSTLLMGLGAVIYYLSQRPMPVATEEIVLPSPTPEEAVHTPDAEEMATPISTPEYYLDIAAVEPDEIESVRLRVIEPLDSYYKESTGSGKLQTLSITKNPEKNNLQFPYIGTAQFDSGVTLGFSIERATNQIEWWTPVCMEECVFSDLYFEAYPEVVVKYLRIQGR